MKKLLFAACLAALLPLMTSCGQKQNAADSFDEPHFVQYAGKLEMGGGGVEPTSLSQRALTSVAQIRCIELTESGLYIIRYQDPDSPDFCFIGGSYTVSGNVYSLNGYGKLEFDKTQSNPINVTITPDGKPAVVVKATYTPSASPTSPLIRSWSVEKTRVTINSTPAASADFTGCNFTEIAKFLSDNGYKVDDSIPSGLSLKTVTFTGGKTIAFTYSDNSFDIGEYNLSGDRISFSWIYGGMDFSFLTESASIEYMDGRCIVKISAKVEGTSGSVIFVLRSVD